MSVGRPVEELLAARERAEWLRKQATFAEHKMPWFADVLREDADMLVELADALEALRAAIREERRLATGTAEHNDALTELYRLAGVER